MKPLSENAQVLRARLEVGGNEPIMVTRFELETELLRANRRRRSVAGNEVARLIGELVEHGADIEKLMGRGHRGAGRARVDGYLLKGWK